MTDPVQAALWLIVASVTVLALCLGGTLIAAGLFQVPARRRAQTKRPANGQFTAAPGAAGTSVVGAPRQGAAHGGAAEPR